MSEKIHDAEEDYGCEYCRNDGRLEDGRCPQCDAEYSDDKEKPNGQ